MTSLWKAFLGWISAAAKTPAGEAVAASTIGADVAAAQAVVKFAEDLIANKATISEGLSAGMSLDKALAPVLPMQIAADAQLALSVAEGLNALYEALPVGWRFIRTDSGPLKGVFDGRAEAANSAAGYAGF